MKCDYCKVNEANTHIKSVINGNVTELNLCPECAAKQNLNKTTFGLMDMFMSAFDAPSLCDSLGDETQCKNCGATFGDIIANSMVGCPDCYRTFYSRLAPTIKKAHGRTSHFGKIPVSSAPRLSSQTRIETLKKRMQSAVEAENFELAATLRDTIRQLEESENG